jgi:uncharacterized protein YdhG (YjbR/CyaY superfamily)
MDSKKINYSTIDEYIAMFPGEIQDKLQAIRQVIKKAAPEAVEKISYQIPTFYQNGNLLHFAAFKDHLSFFPTGSGVEAFKDELSIFKITKGTIQLPLDKPLPLDLIRRITEYRVAQNSKKDKKK